MYQYIEDDNLHLQTTDKLMNELSMLLRSDEVKPCLAHVNSLLTNAILKCRIAIENADKSSSMPQPFSNKENVAPAKKPDHQWKFKKVTGSPGRKKSSNKLR